MIYLYFKCLHALFEFNWKGDVILNRISITKQSINSYKIGDVRLVGTTNFEYSVPPILSTRYHQFYDCKD